MKRFKAVRNTIDIIFITYFILDTVNPNNLWYLLYIFPIISIPRSGGKWLIFLTTLIVIVSNSLLYLTQSHTIDNSFGILAVKCSFFVVLGFSTENLSQIRAAEQKRVTDILSIVSDYINSDSKANNEEEMYKNVLRNALNLTNSQMGHIRLVNAGKDNSDIIVPIGHPPNYNWNFQPMDDSYSKFVIKNKRYLNINSITDKQIKNKLGNYFKRYKPTPRSALFYPVIKDDIVIAIIAVYSKYQFHYSDEDIKRLENFSSLIAVAQDITQVHDDRKKQVEVLNKQIETLNKMASFVTAQEDLKNVLDKVIQLTLEKLNCEEAAIFLESEATKDILRKEAATSFPNTNRLYSKEKTYKIGQFAVGKCFKNKEVIDSKNCSEQELLQEKKILDVYGKILPSRVIKHFVCVPISIGKTKTGVIRVINKRVSPNSPVLSREGFNKDDINLIQIVANQLAIIKLLKDYEKTRSYFESLLQNSPDPIIVINSSAKVTKFNAACEKIWGYKASAVINTFVGDYYESFEHAKEIGDDLSAKRIISREARIKDRRGNLIPINLSAALLYDKEGNHLGSIGIFKDTREQKRKDAKFVENEKLAAIGKLLESSGHEIKTKISIAQNFIKSIKVDQNDQDLAELRDLAIDAAENSARKIQEILDAVKPRETQLRKISLADLFSNSAFAKEKEGFIAQTKANRYEFVYYQKFNDEHLVLIDLEQINQVFLNLFSNSMAAIEEREEKEREENNKSGFVGSIKMSVYTDSGTLVMDWEDNGCGIPESEISEIFHPFVTTKPEGNGLGLFAVERIIKQHRGSITVKSATNQGTIFSINLPIIQEGNDLNE